MTTPTWMATYIAGSLICASVLAGETSGVGALVAGMLIMGWIMTIGAVLACEHAEGIGTLAHHDQHRMIGTRE